MSDLIDRISQQWSERVANEMQSLEVPEWGDESGPLVIYYKPVNLQTRNKIFRYINEGSLQSLVETLIQRALDENGKKLFAPAHNIKLMKQADPDIISRIVGEMNGDLDDTPEQAEKNS